MNVIDVGSGPPLVFIPGIQGRWEWLKPAVDALSRECRVLTFSLCDEPSENGACDDSSDFSCYVDQIHRALDRSGIPSAAICGLSFGGPVAAAFAARAPERTDALILVSALPPGWKADAGMRKYLRYPRLLAPLFFAGALMRMQPELRSIPFADCVRLAILYGGIALRYRGSAKRMSARVQRLERADPVPVSRITAPTLVVTGEESLDRVVPVRSTREYARAIRGARLTTFRGTGHLGFATQPDAFASLVTPFVREHAAPRPHSDQVRKHA